MPTYDYECTACEHKFEEFQSITAKTLKVCPKCGKRKLRRLVGAGAALLFKGSGFYCTDYRSSSYKSQAGSESSANSASSSSSSTAPSSSTKSDSKSSKSDAKVSSGKDK